MYQQSTRLADDNGFKFLKQKLCVHFCNERKLHPDLVLKLNDTVIPVVKEANTWV